MTLNGKYNDENQDLKSIWHQCLSTLKSECDSTIFKSFIEPLNLSSYDQSNQQVTLSVPSSLIKNQVTRRYSNVISKSLNDSLSLSSENSVSINYLVENSIVAEQSHSTDPIIITKNLEATEKPIVTQANSIKSNKTNLNPNYTLESFIIGKSNEVAAEAARQLVESPDQKGPLFFYGDSGLGKTHLIQAIGNHYLKLNPTARVYYTSSENFTNKLVAAIRAGKVEKFKKQIRSIDLLLMDEIQFLANKKHTQEEFLHTFNSLLERGSKIALVADCMPKQLKSIDEKLKNRFSWGVTVDFTAPDFEMRARILKSKAKSKGVKISDQAIEAIAYGIKDNIRELEGVLNRLTVVSSLRNEAIDLEMTETVLNQINQPEIKEISYREIKAITANYFDLKVSDLESKRRLKTISRARQVAIYLIRKHTSIPYLEIGLYFGGRDHSSIIYSANKIDQELKLDQKLQLIVREIERRFL